jgi:hypothetical protein
MQANSGQRSALVDLIEHGQTSGISRKGFYHLHNIPACVYYWHNCYRKQRSGLIKSTSPNSFVELDPSPGPSAYIELQLANGNRVIFHQPVIVYYLKALIF